MKILIAGSSGHLGEALAISLQESGHSVIGFDLTAAEYTRIIGSIADPAAVARAMEGVDAVLHTATLHKPHLASHSRQAFVDTNITGTLNLLEAAARQRVAVFVYTSTTSVFGRTLQPPSGAPAAWITEDTVPVGKNIYGVTKLAAENLCELFAHRHALPCIVLRTSRFFAEPDDDPELRGAYADANVKINELLYRRVDIADVVGAHVQALAKAATIGFGRYIVSATTPFTREDMAELRRDASAVLRRHFPGYEQVFQARNWRMFPRIDRVYFNARARAALEWRPAYDFAFALRALKQGADPRSPLARRVGIKGYHAADFRDGLYPIE